VDDHDPTLRLGIRLGLAGLGCGVIVPLALSSGG
jgi:hypothetical protein